MSFWQNKKVLVTGGAGFIGSHVVEGLVAQKAKVRAADNLKLQDCKNLEDVKEEIEFIRCDFLKLEDCLKATEGIEITFNLAAKVGGIEFNIRHPASIFRDNVLMGTNMLEASRINKNERFLVVSSACVYPRFCKVPTPESEGFVGVPEPTNDGYGWAKRMAEIQADVYSREFGMNIAIARPYNTYGPRDHFEPEKSHVIPALIKRLFDGENPLTVWGDGEQGRAFIFVKDTALGLIALVEKYPVADAVNIGTNEEVKIKDLVKMIVDVSGVKTRIFFDTSKASGQPSRNSDNAKAMEKIGFKAETNLREGLEKTIEWYKKNYKLKGEVK